jgi:hypothetical protein
MLGMRKATKDASVSGRRAEGPRHHHVPHEPQKPAQQVMAILPSARTTALRSPHLDIPRPCGMMQRGFDIDWHHEGLIWRTRSRQ